MDEIHIDESVLNDYADGSLSESGRRAADAHLAQCASCTEELRALRELLATLAVAPRHIAPAHDLRAGIAARTTEAPMSHASWRVRSVWSARYLLAAAAIVLIALSSTITRGVMKRNEARATAVAIGPASSPTDSMAAVAAAQPMPAQAPQVRAELVARREREFAEVESEYARATDDLLDVLKRERSRLTPEAAKALDQNIRVVDKAIAETRAALGARPDDAALRSLVRDSYQRKLDLLRHAAQLTL